MRRIGSGNPLLGLEFVASEMLAMSKAVGATEKQSRRAADRALRNLGRHIVAHSKAAVARQLGIPQNRLKRRYKFSCKEGVLQVWIGTYDVDPMHLGTPRQGRAGVRVGRLPLFTGAFVARVNAGRHEGVYIRRASKHYDPHRYSHTKRPRSQDGRLPIAAAKVEVAGAVEESFVGREADFAERFRRAFAAELNYQTHIRGGAR